MLGPKLQIETMSKFFNSNSRVRIYKPPFDKILDGRTIAATPPDFNNWAARSIKKVSIELFFSMLLTYWESVKFSRASSVNVSIKPDTE